MLGALAEAIPDRERVVTIEDSAELILDQEHVVRMETRPPNIEGRGLITARDLVINALRMRPDRIIVGEVRGGEALDMLQAMNTGHDGGMTTVHANSPRDAFARLETMVLMAGLELPSRAIREQIVSALHLIVHVRRFEDGVRRVETVAEIVGIEGTTPQLQDIFRFERRGMKGRQIVGEFVPTGIVPRARRRTARTRHRDSPHDLSQGQGRLPCLKSFLPSSARGGPDHLGDCLAKGPRRAADKRATGDCRRTARRRQRRSRPPPGRCWSAAAGSPGSSDWPPWPSMHLVFGWASPSSSAGADRQSPGRATGIAPCRPRSRQNRDCNWPTPST